MSKQVIIHPSITGFLLIFVLLIQIAFTRFLPQGKVLGISLDLNESKIISLVNLQRQKEGLTPLKPNDKLAAAAKAKANDMFEFGYWDHYSPTKRPPWTFILNAGYDYHYAGENLAKDYYDDQSLVQAWMDSEPHKANILNKNYEDIGIAIMQGELNGKDTVLVVQMFGALFPASLTESERITQELGAPLLDSKLDQANTFVNTNFQASKIVALIVIGLLLGLLIYDVTKSHRFRNFSRNTKQYWGHFLFLFALGIIIILTRQGSIL
ncbi:hypothetical protein GYA49_01500 [Candidatus Beckwithbacteria bacterium]|nr:hypothetical protein [Candidatus Beckwithbacteria bacterium]